MIYEDKTKKKSEEPSEAALELAADMRKEYADKFKRDPRGLEILMHRLSEDYIACEAAHVIAGDKRGQTEYYRECRDLYEELAWATGKVIAKREELENGSKNKD
jgi:hypothetical protein